MNDSIDDERARIRERKKRDLQRRFESDADVPGSAGPRAPTEPISIRDGAHLERIVGEYDVVLVDCYADWCGPCQMLEPTIAALAAETDAAVAKVDVDAHQGVARQLGARGVPTLVLYAGGEPIERTVGVQDRATLKALIERHS
jgi:thioredoxin 1